MSDHQYDGGAATFLLGLTFGILLSGFTYGCGRDNANERAIQAGVAKYTVDPKTGATQFVYIKPLEETK